MADKEIRIRYSQIANPQTITDVNRRTFKEAGLDIHKHDVRVIHDDHDHSVRVMKIKKPTKYFFQGK